MRRRPKRPLRQRRCGERISSDLRFRAKRQENARGLKNKISKRMAGRNAIVPGGAALFQRVYTRLGCEGRPPRFRVEFYPYSSLVLTIRRREEAVWVRLSDLLRRAPMGVLEGAAALLLARVYRRRAASSLTAPYLDYARSGRTRERINH